MSNHTVPTAVPTEEPAAPDVVAARRHARSPVPGPSRFVLPRGVRGVVTVTSLGLLVAGLVMAVLGGIGTVNGIFAHQLTGVNAIVTGLTLLFTGVVGCVVAFISRADKVKRWILFILVTSCHASGAFAVQCTIIAGQMASKPPPCDDALVPPTGDELVTGSAGPPQNTCDIDTSAWALCLAILLLSVLGFVLGVLCSAVCYYSAPRLLCSICDYPHPYPARPARAGTAAEVEPVLASTEQSQSDHGSAV